MTTKPAENGGARRCDLTAIRQSTNHWHWKRNDTMDLCDEVERLRGALSDITAFIDEEAYDEFPDSREVVPVLPLLAVLGRVGITA